MWEELSVYLQVPQLPIPLKYALFVCSLISSPLLVRQSRGFVLRCGQKEVESPEKQHRVDVANLEYVALVTLANRGQQLSLYPHGA